MFPGPMFPSGLLGVALLLARLAAALVLALAFHGLASGWLALPLVVLAGGLAVGVLTRVLAAACAGLVVFAAIRADGFFAGMLALNAVHVIGLVLTGGGAYSLDARLFGRRVIRLDD